jgi:CubicO group peptidase (beta-lactamase class C family)
MQMVEQGKLNLDSCVINYGVDLSDSSITVKNLLTHTSEIEPGKYFQYNGYRCGKLGQVIEKASGIPFYQLLMTIGIPYLLIIIFGELPFPPDKAMVE